MEGKTLEPSTSRAGDLSSDKNNVLPVSENDKILRHITLLRKEKDEWMTLHREKCDQRRKIHEELDKLEEQDCQTEQGCRLTNEDLEFLLSRPDYNKIGKLCEDLQKNIVIMQGQHDKAMRCFNNVSHKTAVEQVLAARCVMPIFKSSEEELLK